MSETLYGYMGKILRVDLTGGTVHDEPLEPNMVEQYVGGTGFGAEYLYREVPPGVQWDDPENRIIMASGPMGGTTVSGAGAFALVTKGPMTNLAITSQAIGFWGAFLKFCGYDAVVIQGRSPRWVYLHIDDGRVSLRDASSILGKDTWEMEDAIRQDLGETAADERLRHRTGGRGRGPLRGRRRRQGPHLFEKRLRDGDGGQTAQGGSRGPRETGRSRVRQGDFPREGQRPRRAREGVPAEPLQMGNGGRFLRASQRGEPPGPQPYHQHLPRARKHERAVSTGPISSTRTSPAGPAGSSIRNS